MKSKAHRQLQELRLVTKDLRRNSFGLYARLLARLLEAHNTYDFLKPLSDAVRRKEWKEVYAVADSLSAQRYADPTSHFVGNQFALLIKKYPWDSALVGLDPEKTAIENFYRSERRNRRINRKFSLISDDPSRDVFRSKGKAAMAWIRSVIGASPSYSSIARECDFGQGASVGVHGDATHVLRKISNEQKWTVTPGAIHHAFAGLMNNHHYFETLMLSKTYSDGRSIACVDYDDTFKRYVARLDMINSNKISFVSKTAKTHRSIATEPLLNGFYQKGIDQVMRRKLLRIGLDLGDQELNQKLAREGSLDDSADGYVTIDLKNASNSLSREVVKYLLPRDWYAILDRTRSHYLSFRGAETRYEMFCSMGNGFCFPLQTLIFASVCISCGCGVPGVDFRVYGDDIIVRKKFSAEVLSMLKHLGFGTNKEKTFVEGPFRESCGTDWFAGEDVRPFTLDYALDKVESFYKFLNQTRLSKRVEDFFASVRGTLIDALPRQYQFFRPFKGEVDTGIDSSGDEHLSCQHCTYEPWRHDSHGGWSWRELVQRPIIDRDRLAAHGHEPWLMGVALRGARPVPYGIGIGLPTVTFRRKTRAEVVRKNYSSASNWLPTASSYASASRFS